MTNQRQLRANELIRKILSEYLIKEDFSIDNEKALITISNVNISPDFRYANIYISSIDNRPIDDIIDYLNNQKGKLSHYLSKSHQMKYSPKIKFFPDETVTYAMKIEKLLKDNTDPKN